MLLTDDPSNWPWTAYINLPLLPISLFLLRRLLGVKTEDKKQTKVSKLAKGELLLINIGSTSTGGRVLSVKADLAKIQLTSPACTEIVPKGLCLVVGCQFK